ncbi:MAG: hypothetical protein H6797_05395 [Candidatus Nomurabacteria bacterium]|nr:MAG: hypothetical protein H6797_05395 [Candidatus Nomurabacteria bacterium]
MYSIETVVRSELRDGKGYRLKVSILDLGLYIDGFRALKSERNQNGWWVQPPSNLVKGVWVTACEFDKTKAFWLNIEQSCVDAIATYLSEDRQQITQNSSRDILPADDEMEDVLSKGFEFPPGWDEKTPEPRKEYHP